MIGSGGHGKWLWGLSFFHLNKTFLRILATPSSAIFWSTSFWIWIRFTQSFLDFVCHSVKDAHNSRNNMFLSPYKCAITYFKLWHHSSSTTHVHWYCYINDSIFVCFLDSNDENKKKRSTISFWEYSFCKETFAYQINQFIPCIFLYSIWILTYFSFVSSIWHSGKQKLL